MLLAGFWLCCAQLQEHPLTGAIYYLITGLRDQPISSPEYSAAAAAAAAGVRAEQKNCRVPRHPSSAAAAHQLHLIKLSKSDIRQTTLAQAHTTVGCNNPYYFLEI